MSSAIFPVSLDGRALEFEKWKSHRNIVASSLAGIGLKLPPDTNYGPQFVMAGLTSAEEKVEIEQKTCISIDDET